MMKFGHQKIDFLSKRTEFEQHKLGRWGTHKLGGETAKVWRGHWQSPLFTDRNSRRWEGRQFRIQNSEFLGRMCHEGGIL